MLSYFRGKKKIVEKQSLSNSVTKCFICNPLFLIIIQIIFFTQVYGQTVSISGKVSSFRYPVRDASVTFIDNADTTRKFSAVTDASGNYQMGIPTSVESNVNTRPTEYELGQNYPNPFSSTTTIPYDIKKETSVQVTIYDILGRVVKKIDAGQQAVGRYNILWDGSNNFGFRVANGIYFYKLDAGVESQVRKMIFKQTSGGLVSLPQTFSSNESFLKTNLNQDNQAATYTARIENTNTTSPYVVVKEFPNIVVANDTTINFSVDYLPMATIDFDSLHQYIRGFGAANILPWRPDMTDSEIQTAFGIGEGQLGFTILRLMIQPDNNQWSMNVSTAKKAYDMGAIVFASPWNAPTDMVEIVDGQTRVRYDMYDEYAQHLDSFNSYMNNNNAPLYAVSIQNEPDYANDWTGWTSDEMLRFMKENAHTIGNKVMAPESFQFRRNMSDPILNDSVACANLDILGGHIYGGGLAAYPLTEEKGKEIWMTEHLTGETSHSNDWSWALPVATEINNVMKAGMSAYVWWYIVRYYGPIGDGEKVDLGGGRKGEVTKKGYVMSQFSRFIRPGFYRVESSVAPSLTNVDATAYKDTSSSKVVIVAINSGSNQKETAFRIQNGAMMMTLTPYTTSASKNCEQGNTVNVADGSFIYNLEPLSITTFVSD